MSLLLRPLAFFPALIAGGDCRWKNRALIGWFGPRGLSTLLLVMLPVFEGIEGSDYLLQICCLVVLVSVVLHGFSPMLLLRAPERRNLRRRRQKLRLLPCAAGWRSAKCRTIVRARARSPSMNIAR